MKLINEYKSIKEKIQCTNQLTPSENCPVEVRKAIANIKDKMNQCKLSELHPPLLPKTVTKYRHEYFLPIKRQYHTNINSNNPQLFQSAIKYLYYFVSNFDCEMFDVYL